MSTFGTIFRVSTFGESHCFGVGCIVDGCPPGLPLTEEDIQVQLSRRRPGQSILSTPRDEKDKVKILSGTEFGITLGTPIALMVQNLDQRPHDYKSVDESPRPSHADYTYVKKYGLKASSGGGRSSARETIGRVAAGAIAEKILKMAFGVEIVAFVSGVGKAELTQAQVNSLFESVTREKVDLDPTRCPVPEVAAKMKKIILDAKERLDSIGGTITCVARNVPRGLGEPCFDKLEAKLAHAMLSIPATKGFEIGSGFSGTSMFGHEHNDLFVSKSMPDGSTRLGTETNYSGGIQVRISNGENIYFRIAFKPPATISLPQATVSYEGNESILEAKGRHDPCVVTRAVSIVETMTALVLMDALAIQTSRVGLSSRLSLSKEELNKAKALIPIGTGKPEF